MNKKTNATLWTIQVLLAALFLFAGIFKLAMPIEPNAGLPFSEAFLRFIGLAETLGGLGLILPGLSRIQPRLTPLAAYGLAIIMIGATAFSAPQGPAAAFPAIVGVLCAFVAYGRTRLVPHQQRTATAVAQPA